MASNLFLMLFQEIPEDRDAYGGPLLPEAVISLIVIQQETTIDKVKVRVYCPYK